MQTLQAAAFQSIPQTGLRLRVTPELGIHADIFRLAHLHPRAVLALNWSQLPIRMGRCTESLVLSGMRMERGAQGWNVTPKRFIFLTDSKKKSNGLFSPAAAFSFTVSF